MELGDESQNTSKNGNDTATMVSQGDPNAAYITIPEDLVHLVRGSGGQIQTVHVTDGDGDVQEIEYTYVANEGESLPTLVTTDFATAKQDDPSFEFYDNARGKINTNILAKLVAKHNADDLTTSKQENLLRWTEITDEYNSITNQSKSRSVLMKRWSTIKAQKKHEVVKLATKDLPSKKESNQQDESGDQECLKKSVLIKQLKSYDTYRIEAAQYERDARKLEMENAQLENEALRKENTILDVQLETAKLQLALLQEKM